MALKIMTAQAIELFTNSLKQKKSVFWAIHTLGLNNSGTYAGESQLLVYVAKAV